MADEADRANDQAAEMLQRSIAFAMIKKPLIQATGVCLNCSEPLEGDRRFCDKDCLQDWERRRSFAG